MKILKLAPNGQKGGPVNDSGEAEWPSPNNDIPTIKHLTNAY